LWAQSPPWCAWKVGHQSLWRSFQIQRSSAVPVRRWIHRICYHLLPSCHPCLKSISTICASFWKHFSFNKCISGESYLDSHQYLIQNTYEIRHKNQC
jgi:hypothetical protein